MKTGIKVTHKFYMKVLAFIGVIVMLAITVLGIFCAVGIASSQVYTMTENEFKSQALEEALYSDGIQEIYYHIIDGDTVEAKRLCEEKGIAWIQLRTEKDSVWMSMANKPIGLDKYNLTLRLDEEDVHGNITKYYLDVILSEDLPQGSAVYYAELFSNLIYGFRFFIYIIIAAALDAAITCFVFLMCSSGRKRDFADPQPGWGTKFPLDILIVIYLFAIFLFVQVQNLQWSGIAFGIVGIVLCLITAVMTIGLFMSIALRFKLGGWWKNTFAWWMLIALRHGLKIFWRGVRKLGKLVGQIPLIWKTVVGIVLLSIIEIIVIVTNIWEGDNIAVFWIVEKILLIPAVLYCALCLKKLQFAGKSIAEGNLDYKMNTSMMIMDFKDHGENLNKISQGINLAVEQKLKSERMKTELITNVSHDIKTPLTSIINYTDLITKEHCENEKIIEYSEILYRQSERLKHLIEDLVEASKASTGNIELNLESMDLGVMLTQVTGEYEQKLLENRLELIVKRCEEDVKIMADGRRVWRIFDNLMNNIVKYALSGTRVYLTLERQQNKAVISFKNTSREALDLTAQELTERFTRGDASRGTEGNGLGLSIAKSLVELQKGTITVFTDGDLFKVILEFPLA